MSYLCEVNSDNNHIRDVKLIAKAMSEIPVRECMTEPYKIAERNYVSALKCAICKSLFKDKKHYNSDIIISIEIKKQLDRCGEDKISDYYPDLVFHENHRIDDLDTRKQYLICEVKATKRLFKKNFCHDFRKLNLYLDKLKFQKALYFLVLTNKEKVETLLKWYVEHENDYLSLNASNIFFLIQNELEGEIGVYRFNQSK